MKMLNDSLECCPHCNENLQGEMIPEESQWMFGATHFSEKIGIYDTDKDRTVSYQCPYCDGQWECEYESMLAIK